MVTRVSGAELACLIGQDLEPSEWLEITQERVNQFAEVTGDHQFIHVDPEGAAATPFGGTVAHGFLTLSLVPFLTAQSGLQVEGLRMAVNYGSDRLRFLQPVRVGSHIRSRQQVLDVIDKGPGQYLLKSQVTIEIKDEPKPALVAEMLALYFLA